MGQFSMVLWALFFTLLVPLLLWTSLFAMFGWKLFLVLFAAMGLVFFFRDKIFSSSAFQGLLQFFIPFALTFRFYDALRAGNEKKGEDANLFQVLWATARGFAKGDEEEEAVRREQVPAATKKQPPTATPIPAPESAPPPASASAPAPAPKPNKVSDEQLDDMLDALKEKMKQDK